MMNKFLAILLFILWADYVKAQASGSTLLHLDRPYYVTGETLWFRLFLPDELDWDGAILDVQISYEGQEVLETFRIQAKEGMASGNFKIPYDWSSANYLMVIGANDNSLDSRVLIKKWVDIYNDLEDRGAINPSSVKAPEVVIEDLDSPSDLIFQSQETLVLLEMDTTDIKRRDFISLKVKVLTSDGVPARAELSVSVTDKKLVGSSNESKTFAYKNFSPDFYEPARQIVVRGAANYIDAGTRTYSIGIGAFDQYQGDVHLFSTDLTGEFAFTIPGYKGDRSIQFQDYFGREIRMSLASLAESEESGMNLAYNDEITEYLERSEQRKKINQHFNRDQVTLGQDREIIPFIDPDRSILLSDYESFSSIEEFFKNVVAPLKVFNHDGELTFKMVNPKNKPFFEGIPLFIVDRYVVRDQGYIAGLDLEDIERFDLYFDQDRVYKHFGYLGRGGVAAIYTKDGARSLPSRLKKNLFDIQGIQDAYEFPKLSVESVGKNIPYFRPTIYWNPDVAIDRNGEASIDFVHSDDRSEFQVEICGVTSEGEVIIKRKTYRVK